MSDNPSMNANIRVDICLTTGKPNNKGIQMHENALSQFTLSLRKV